MMRRLFRSSFLTVTLSVSVSGCLAAQSSDGVFTRALGIQVRPSSVSAREGAIASLAKMARGTSSDESSDWLVYRAGPTRYWIIVNRESAAEIVTPERLFPVFDELRKGSDFSKAMTSLQATDYSVTMDTLWQQVPELSTVNSMSTATHPLAVVTEYSVRPGMEAEFEDGMRDYVSFLKNIEYSYPVEGFRWRLGRPGRYWSVTFADSWSQYHGAEALEKLAERKNAVERLEALHSALLDTAQSVVETHLTYAPELSF